MIGVDERVVNGVAILAAIVDRGGFAAAGEMLGMSQSGVSRSVARLEARLGIRLFDRTTRSVRLTDEGRRFYEQVMPLIAGLEEATVSAREGATAVRGRLRVNLDPYFSRLILAPRLEAFLGAHPDLQLELITLDHLGDLIADGYDLAVRFGHPRASTLVARKLLDTRILTVAAPSYLKRRGRPSEPREIESGGHTCILFRDSATGQPFPWEFHRRKKRIVMEVRGPLLLNDAGTLHSVCLAGLGIAQMMDLGAEQMLAEGRLVDLFPDWNEERFPLYAYHPSRHHVPAKTRAFLDFVVSLVHRPSD